MLGVPEPISAGSLADRSVSFFHIFSFRFRFHAWPQLSHGDQSSNRCHMPTLIATRPLLRQVPRPCHRCMAGLPLPPRLPMPRVRNLRLSRPSRPRYRPRRQLTREPPAPTREAPVPPPPPPRSTLPPLRPAPEPKVASGVGSAKGVRWRGELNERRSPREPQNGCCDCCRPRRGPAIGRRRVDGQGSCHPRSPTVAGQHGAAPGSAAGAGIDQHTGRKQSRPRDAEHWPERSRDAVGADRVFDFVRRHAQRCGDAAGRGG